jgi:hypothetical protein
MPTGSFPSSLCSRCQSAIETSDHILSCPNTQATSTRKHLLDSFLSEMHQAGTPNYILSTLEYKLSLTLHIKYVQTFFSHGQIPPNNYPLLLQAIRHQNFIGWDNFLQGYTSVYWVSLFNLAHSDNSKQQSTRWDVKLVTSGIQILKEIWSDRNSQFHGTIKAETRILHRERILNQVHHIYAHPPRLHKRFPRVTAIPLATRVSGSTTNLER